jgi:hypothetical protein
MIELAPVRERIRQTPEEGPIDPLDDSETPAGPTGEAGQHRPPQNVPARATRRAFAGSERRRRATNRADPGRNAGRGLRERTGRGGGRSPGDPGETIAQRTEISKATRFGALLPIGRLQPGEGPMSSIDIRIGIIRECLADRITAREASERLGLHRVTFWRLVKRYERFGRRGLEHGLKGGPRTARSPSRSRRKSARRSSGTTRRPAAACFPFISRGKSRSCGRSVTPPFSVGSVTTEFPKGSNVQSERKIPGWNRECSEQRTGENEK